LSGRDAALGVGSLDCYGRDPIGVAGLAFMQPGGDSVSPRAAQPVGGLVAGEQDQRGLAGAVVKGAFQRGKVLNT